MRRAYAAPAVLLVVVCLQGSTAPARQAALAPTAADYERIIAGAELSNVVADASSTSAELPPLRSGAKATGVSAEGAFGAQTDFSAPTEGGTRYLAFISDHHMGLGRRADGTWHPTEDFRWPNAFKGFLDEVSRLDGDAVDLVIVGDLLELWQPPEEIECIGVAADLGCTVEEMESLAKIVVGAHAPELEALGEFSRRGDNRLHIIPGNHDSTLLLQRVWKPLAKVLGAESGRVNLVTSGVWASPDGRVIAEHGHQIGRDVNRYADWPDVTRRVDGVDYVVRPWGERFVQKLFNDEEQTYPLIDNLSPETAGARYRMADRGLWRSTVDVARFIAFNLFETSLNQKGAFLGREADGAERPVWTVQIGRELGHRLFAEALREDDPFRVALLDENAEAEALRHEMDMLARDSEELPDEQVKLLCDQIAIRGSKLRCERATLGYLFEAKLIPRERVLRGHLEDRWQQFPKMQVFVYGHTHQLEEPWPLALTSLKTVSVLNTGAFQRLVGEEGFLERTKSRGLTPAEGLRHLSLDKLPPCYTVVVVPYERGLPNPQTMVWYMPEDGIGEITRPDDLRCQ